jgi:hypothetical protein
MNLPIQAAPVDRTNRAIAMAATSKTHGITPNISFGQIGDVVCGHCDLLPGLLGTVCKIVCGLRS